MICDNHVNIWIHGRNLKWEEQTQTHGASKS
jgi:hypothetical protein